MKKPRYSDCSGALIYLRFLGLTKELRSHDR
jgi:hypothetical protein